MKGLGFTGHVDAPGPTWEPGRTDLAAWLARHRLDANEVAELDVRPLTVHARVFDRNLLGKHYVRPDGEVATRWVRRLKRTLLLPATVVVSA